MQEELRISAQELSKVSVIQSVIARNITQVAAAKILGLSERQLRRLKKTMSVMVPLSVFILTNMGYLK
jgi:hypothetical protein